MVKSLLPSLLLLTLLGGCQSTGAAASGSTKTDGSSDGSVALEMDEFTVPAGGEAYKCQNYANRFGNVPVDVDRFEAHMPHGSHHMIVFSVDDLTDGSAEDCSAFEFHPNVLGAQVPDSVIDFPAGVGVAIPPKSGFRVQLHFVNTTAQDAVAGVTMKFHVAKPGTITNHAGQLLFSNQDITIPSGVPTDVTKTCSVPKAISLLGVSAHVHRHAVSFRAETGGKVLYETTTLPEAVPRRFDPPFELPANQDVDFTCSYVNDTGNTIVFGESGITNEMCILGALYYPADDVTSPNITCF
jgi:hypothetical protein